MDLSTSSSKPCRLCHRSDRKRKAAVLFAAWWLLLFQGVVFPAWSQDAPGGIPPVNPNKARVFVTSDPTGRPIVLNDHRLDEITPVELELNPGKFAMTINAEGFQPLSHEVTFGGGEHLELNFILLETPPEPPTQEELRKLAPLFGADDPNSKFWAAAGPRQLANESCRSCHPVILTLHAQGEHRTLSCEDCHGSLSDHVKDDVVIGESQVIRGEGIQPLCMTCHDRDNRSRTREPARTVLFPGHLRDLRVREVNRCEDCHHVHDPMKWVHEARDMVGLPELMASIPMMDEKIAREKQKKYNSLAEIFLVFPTAPGLLGMTAFSKNDGFPAEELFFSGVALVAGSYLLGKYFSSRELTRIRAINEERLAANVQVRDYNEKVREEMNNHYDALILWEEMSEGRGVVVVIER